MGRTDPYHGVERNPGPRKEPEEEIVERLTHEEQSRVDLGSHLDSVQD